MAALLAKGFCGQMSQKPSTLSVNKKRLKKPPALVGSAALGAKGVSLDKFFKRSTPIAQAAALAHAEGVRRGEEARGLVEMAAWQRTEESLKRKQEPKPTSKCNINIAAVELCLRDHGQHTEKQIVQLCKIAAELQTKPTDVTNVCLRFEGTLRSFGRCREDDIGTLLALIKPEPSAKRRKLTCTKPQLECHQRAAVVWLSPHLDVKIAKVVQMLEAAC